MLKHRRNSFNPDIKLYKLYHQLKEKQLFKHNLHNQIQTLPPHFHKIPHPPRISFQLQITRTRLPHNVIVSLLSLTPYLLKRGDLNILPQGLYSSNHYYEIRHAPHPPKGALVCYDPSIKGLDEY